MCPRTGSVSQKQAIIQQFTKSMQNKMREQYNLLGGRFKLICSRRKQKSLFLRNGVLCFLYSKCMCVFVCWVSAACVQTSRNCLGVCQSHFSGAEKGPGLLSVSRSNRLFLEEFFYQFFKNLRAAFKVESDIEGKEGEMAKELHKYNSIQTT